MATLLMRMPFRRRRAGARVHRRLRGAGRRAAAGSRSIRPRARSRRISCCSELDRIAGRSTLPDQKACTIEQPAGRDWRQFHQVTLPWIGAIAILGMLALLVVFYLVRGMVRIEAGAPAARSCASTAFERFVHWMTATCFIILAITGLNITFGKQLLLPLMGPEAFTAISQWGKYAHNYLSFPFTLGVVLIFLMWIAWNIPNRVDVAMGEARRRHRRRPAIRRPIASTPARR